LTDGFTPFAGFALAAGAFVVGLIADVGFAAVFVDAPAAELRAGDLRVEDPAR